MALNIYGTTPNVNALEWSEMHDLISDQIVTGMASIPRSGSIIRQVDIGTGLGSAAGVLFRNTTTATVGLDVNSGSNPRIDTIVINIFWPGVSGTNGFSFVKGTAAASPAPPALVQVAGTQWQVPIANVTVNPGATSLSTPNIDDARPTRRRLMVYRSTPAGGQTMAGAATTPQQLDIHIVTDPGWRWRPRISAQQKFTSVAAGFGRIDVTIDGVSVMDGRAPIGNDGTANIYYIGPVRTGKAQIRLRMVPQSMSVQLETTSAYSSFSVEVEPI